MTNFVIASAAKQSSPGSVVLDCFVASAPRNDECATSEAKLERAQARREKE
jgi:hypothetical protein